MSGKEEVKEADICCANCGVAEVDDIKLEDCDGCDLVKYCSDGCQEGHREKHEEECKKRAKKLHDDDLFTQPDGSHFGECPICFLPMPLDPDKSTFKPCCSKLLCNGCCYAHYVKSGSDTCPFCREPLAGEEEYRKRNMKRVKKNDPAALSHKGMQLYNEGDYDSAVKYWKKAAELGDLQAHYQLGDKYQEGDVVEKDMEKAVYHYEKAAIGGHPWARHLLALIEVINGNIERAVQHFIINANLGEEDSMKELWGHYAKGDITKEDLDATLRTHQAAIDETKSEQRDAAEAFFRNRI
jgi:tetratricopeptide (TPR) repeat protein